MLVKVTNPLHELLGSSLLEQTHQWRREGFGGSGGDFGDGGPGALTLLHVTACYLSELQVSCDVGGNEDIGEFTVGHEELGYEIDVPIVQATIFLPWFFAFLVVAISFEELEHCQPGIEDGRRRLTASMFRDADSLPDCQTRVVIVVGMPSLTRHSGHCDRCVGLSCP